MINWKPLANLINLYDNLHLIFKILDTDETLKFKDLIQEWSDRLYNKIRDVYLDYTYVVEEEIKEC